MRAGKVSVCYEALERRDEAAGDLGFGIWDLGFGIWDLGFGIADFRIAHLMAIHPASGEIDPRQNSPPVEGGELCFVALRTEHLELLGRQDR
jgi:hypothetical protein